VGRAQPLRDDLHLLASDEFLRPVAEDGFDGGVGEQDSALRIDGEYPFGGVREQRLEELLVGRQRLVGHAAHLPVIRDCYRPG
jgi:hypothetical protein